MRNIDEQMAEIKKRSDRMKRKQLLRQKITADTAAVCACLVLLVAAAPAMPAVSYGMQYSAGTYYGSLLLPSSTLGYVVIAVLGFLLGICVTLLCVHMHKQKEEGEDR